jgi:TolB-like protein
MRGRFVTGGETKDVAREGSVRRVFAAFLLASSFALIAAAPPPAPKATPTPLPSPPSAAPKLPLVVVYPFDFSTDMRADTGVKTAQLYISQMNAAGGLDALQGPTTVKRASYLDYARSLSAAYYVAGYMTPLGGGVSLVEQVVDTSTGTIVLGATAQITSFEDATSQAITLRDGIVAREQSKAQAFADSSAQATPAPLASNQANIGGGIAGLFKRRGRPTPEPHPSAIVKPAKGIFVVRVGGSPSTALLNDATSALYTALNHRYIAHNTNSGGDASKMANTICGADRNNTVATGTLTSKSARHGFFSRTQYSFIFDVYTCFGAKLAETSADGDTVQSAVSAAVAAYAADHPQNS